MSTHKITPETKVPFPCWLWASDRCPPRWMWIDTPCPEDFTFNGPSCIYQFTHYSTNPPDQPPLGEPAPEGSLPDADKLLATALSLGDHEPGITAPSAPSLQSVAEGAVNEIRQTHYAFNPDVQMVGPLAAILTRHFAPLLTERDERIGRLEKELQGMESQRDNQVERKRVGREKLHEIIAALRTRCEELERLLDVARCPDFNCDNNGSSWHTEEDFQGNSIQVQHQCQWCDERATLRAARKEGQP